MELKEGDVPVVMSLHTFACGKSNKMELKVDFVL